MNAMTGAQRAAAHCRPMCSNPDDAFVAACWAAGFTVKSFATAVDRTIWTIRSWRTGFRQPDPLTREIAQDWLRAHGVDPALLFGEPMPKPAHLRLVPPNPEENMQRFTREYLDEGDLKWFRLKDDPFDDGPNPEEIYLSTTTNAAEKAMKTAVQRRHIIAVCGDPGSGKSTLLRRFLARSARESQVRILEVASLDRTRIDATTLAVAVLRDLGVPGTASMSAEERSEKLRTTLAAQGAAGMHPILVIDEAHGLKPKALLSIKQLWDSASLFHQLAVALIGHKTLSIALRNDPSLAELAGRTKIVEMTPLGKDGTAAYLRWRFARIEADSAQVFTPAAIEKIATRGEYPLWISNIAVLAMKLAHAGGDQVVDVDHVGKV